MISDILLNVEKKMEKAASGLKMELGTIRTGRASPTLIEHLKVEYAGVPTSLNQIASISAPEVRLLVVQPWDRSYIRDIEKAILKSEFGLNPMSDGNLIRINIPPLTEERRLELVRAVRRRVEERRITLRNLRREAVDELKRLEKSKDISQDEYKRAFEQVQKLTDNFIAQTDQIGQDKEKELTEV